MLGQRAALLLLAACLLGSPLAAGPLRINGSTTVNPVAAEAADILRREQGMEIQVDTLGGSSGGIAAVGDGRVEIGMASRPLGEADRRRYPSSDLHPVTIGFDAVALVVSRDVWDGGVRSISRQQMRQVYEGRIRNWKQLGGPDRRIAFFNKEPGRGTWEVFADWLYGGAAAAPLASFPEVGANEEARSKVGSTRGALSQLSASWADGERVFALAIRQASGEVIAPTPANVAGGRYPMRRPLLLVTRGAPSSESKAFVDFVLSRRGQQLLDKHGYLALPRPTAMVGGSR